MAAPESTSIKNLSGKWVLNSALSGDIDGVLTIQGIGYAYRTAITTSTITLHCKHFTDDEGEHIDIRQVSTAYIPWFKSETEEKRHPDGQWRDHEDYLFGKVKGQTKWVELAGYEDPTEDKFLKTGWLPETENGDVIMSYVEREDETWNATQIWGFEEINGERRYARHILVKAKDGKEKKIRLVYDYAGSDVDY
ncbi:MAG: hypothetical protein M1820_006417 [Bogoriella megaspora]|nr:MAG: hypothetical protein M1820_006417 [Bogoriella megaspora]